MTITKQLESFNKEELNFLYETILELAEYGRDKYDQAKSIAKFMKDFSDLTEAHFPDAKAKIINLDGENTIMQANGKLDKMKEELDKMKEELDKYENLLSKIKPLIEIINEKD